MSLWNNLSGMRRAQLISADPKGALLRIQRANITILDIQFPDAMTLVFTVSRSDGDKIKKMAKIHGEKFVFLRKFGVVWILPALRKRPVLILGIIALTMLSLWVPSRVFFVAVEGNLNVPSRLIAEKAETCGIYFGASRRSVRCQQVKNNLLSQISQLQWVGVKTVGCVAVITVREKSILENESVKNPVSSIVAARDGILTEVTVVRGNGLCKPGQAVKAGQVLISGYTDCGICVKATSAAGEILARTQRRLTAIFPGEYTHWGEIIGIEENISLIIGKKQINFRKDSGISGGSCAKIYEQKYMTLPGGFILPISVIRERTEYYETYPDTPEDTEQLLRDLARRHITAQISAGKIENAWVYVSATEGLFRLEGVYGCLENIGTMRVEESLPNYGKSD